MKKRILSALLAAVMTLSLLPAAAFAAEDDLPDWYFLIAIFKNVDADGVDKNGVAAHATYTMSQDEIDLIRHTALDFETFMNRTGVMRAHVDIVEIDTTVTELKEYNGGGGSFLGAEQATPLLEDKVDLDRYDHVTCVVCLDDFATRWAGVSSSAFENGAGHSCLNLVNREHILRDYNSTVTHWWPASLFGHEFIHFLEWLSKKFNHSFDMHAMGEIYKDNPDFYACFTDIFLNQVNGNAETGTGVHPAVWLYPPHVMRTMTELTIPSSVTSISRHTFLNFTNLTSVTIPSSVTSIGEFAFQHRTGLTELTISSGVANIERGAFYDCTALTRVTIPSTVSKVGNAAFQDCSGLTEVTISSGVASIDTWAFTNCTSLARLYIPASVTSIGEVAFYNTGLKDVYYSGTEAQWKAIEIGRSNAPLTNATIHYNSLMADVKTADWFAQPVAWALENSVTNGTGGGNFSPARTCNQGEILTFLWRAVGQPEPAGAVSGTQFYAKAAQWAKEQGLTDNFKADAPCTRADVVTYLWKLAGSPSAGSANFSDVPASASYAQAVAWAVSEGVTNGTSTTTFSPNDTCTRGQIVTFLYRALG